MLRSYASQRRQIKSRRVARGTHVNTRLIAYATNPVQPVDKCWGLIDNGQDFEGGTPWSFHSGCDPKDRREDSQRGQQNRQAAIGRNLRKPVGQQIFGKLRWDLSN
ncbi:MAG TPA: hypothetical protein DCS24_03835 [Erythrobacter sp.]|nr:hypothetical protein [Erythrobacter sp.]